MFQTGIKIHCLGFAIVNACIKARAFAAEAFELRSISAEMS
jgi:hypothetical protein